MTSRTTVAERPGLAIAVLCAGGLSAALTQTMVIPIQSELPQLLSTSASNASWVITITLLAAAVTMPVAGRIADMVGKQRVLTASAALLTIGSVVCAVSDSLVPVLAGRALQGLAMGFIPVGISFIRQFAPPEMASTGVATMSATLGVGGAIGLPLAAWIADSGDWHALFWVAAGLSAVITALTWFAVPHVHDGHDGTLDVPGTIGLAIGLSSFLVGVSKGSTWGWDSGRTWGAIVLGIVVLLLWGLFELRQAEPLVDLRTTAQLPVLMTNLAAVAIGFGMMAQSIVVPQLLQMPEATGYGLGQSILAAGLWMAPAGLMMMVFAPVSSSLMRSIGSKHTLMIGAAVLGTGYLVAIVLMGAPWQLLDRLLRRLGGRRHRLRRDAHPDPRLRPCPRGRRRPSASTGSCDRPAPPWPLRSWRPCSPAARRPWVASPCPRSRPSSGASSSAPWRRSPAWRSRQPCPVSYAATVPVTATRRSWPIAWPGPTPDQTDAETDAERSLTCPPPHPCRR